MRQIPSARMSRWWSATILAALCPATLADRTDMPVVITGSQLPLWVGRPVDAVYVLAYDAGGHAWRRIPAQVDERRAVLLATCLNNPSYGNVDPHLSYVFTGTEGNGLDADDEIVFLAGDGAGDAAPLSAWPPGTDDVRYEIRIDDGGGAPLGYCYLFTAPSPPLPPASTDYVVYSFTSLDGILEDTLVTTDRYRVHYAARWRLNELAVPPSGGGAGTDMIDRIKYREATDATAYSGENEELWDQTSCFLGHKDGPVRAIREVQGAASGVNTTYTAMFYRALFNMRVNLRVHAVPNIVYFVDYNASAAPLTYYNPANPAGIIIDGAADPGMNLALVNWEMASHPVLGAVFFHRAEVVPVPALSRATFWFDNGSFADRTGDDEPGRYGCHGLRFNSVASTDDPGSEAVLVLTVIPLAAGMANIGATLADQMTSPPFAALAPQTRPSFPRGDMNCDGGTTLADLQLFVEALLDPAGFDAAHPDCPSSQADIDLSGAPDGLDIPPFVGALLGP